MKKITLNESDILKMIRKVLNEQEIRQFNEDEIEFLNFIFERELKPPFIKGNKDNFDNYLYYNRNYGCVGKLSSDKYFVIAYDPFWINIEDKICQVFGDSYNTWGWYHEVKPHLKSWMEDQINIKLDEIG